MFIYVMKVIKQIQKIIIIGQIYNIINQIKNQHLYYIKNNIKQIKVYLNYMQVVVMMYGKYHLY